MGFRRTVITELFYEKNGDRPITLKTGGGELIIEGPDGMYITIDDHDVRHFRDELSYFIDQTYSEQ